MQCCAQIGIKTNYFQLNLWYGRSNLSGDGKLFFSQEIIPSGNSFTFDR